MALDFNTGADWASLSQNLQQPNVLGQEKKSYKDDRFWSLSRDENDNGVALIRLLPDPSGTPFIKVYSHAIQSWDAVNKKKRWYLNTSPETIEQPCPASELWREMFNLGTNEAKEEARMFSRKMNYYVNVKIIKDPLNPENEGQIKLWKFGTKLFDKFMAALNPSEQDRAMGEQPKELFNPLTGNNIKLKIKKANGFFNYDDTTIEPASTVYPDAETAKADIIENAHKLSEFLEPASYKTYEESVKQLKWVTECYTPKHLDPMMFKQLVTKVLGEGTSESNTSTTASEPQINTGMDLSSPEPVNQTTTPSPEPEVTINADAGQTTPTPTATTPTTSGGADDDLDFLNEL
jgi:hypothetical protein